MKKENNDRSNELEAIQLLLCIIIAQLAYMAIGEEFLQLFNL